MFFTPKNDKSNITPGYPNIPNTKKDTDTSTQERPPLRRLRSCNTWNRPQTGRTLLKNAQTIRNGQGKFDFYLLIKISAK